MANNDRKFIEIEISNIEAYINLCMKLRQSGFWSFRGQRNSDWDLVPHIFNEDEYSSFLSLSRDGQIIKYQETINKNIEMFKRYFSESIELHSLRERDNEWNWLFYAQHYGLKTQLLDWSSNPLIALYFAVENIITSKDNQNKIGAVWAIQVPKKRFIDDIKKREPDSIDEWALINPPPIVDLVPRMNRQSSKFTIHREPFALTDYLKSEDKLIKIIIGNYESNPSDIIIKQLGIMNIHHASLFPEPENITKYINIQWRLISTYENLEKMNIKYRPDEKTFQAIEDLDLNF